VISARNTSPSVRADFKKADKFVPEARYRAPMDRLDLKCVCLRTRTWTPLEPHREKLLGDARQPCIRIVITYTDVSLSW
jgi:hypothetical protein